jgi:thiamine-phosphate pyrophosphorylase
LLSLCRRYQRPFIINDYVDLCLALDADGIHVGGTDASVAEVRAMLGADKIVGASCYGDLELAHAAYRAGASYVAFGGFYPSRVKKYPVTTSPDIVTRAKAEIAVPNVVIGGMTQENAAPLIAAGADMVAAISSVYLADDPAAAARSFVALFENR